MTEGIKLTIYGEPASKANSRRLVKINGKPRSIKSAKALDYSTELLSQVPILDPLLTGELCAEITIYYRTQRPDLDESLILDLLQGRIYHNDRQIRERHVYHRIDKERPRTVINIRPRA